MEKFTPGHVAMLCDSREAILQMKKEFELIALGISILCEGTDYSEKISGTSTDIQQCIRYLGKISNTFDELKKNLITQDEFLIESLQCLSGCSIFLYDLSRLNGEEKFRQYLNKLIDILEKTIRIIFSYC